MKTQKKLHLLFWIFTLVPIIIILITEANKTILIGYMRVVDFVDLLFLAPFFLTTMLAIHQAVFSETLNHKSSWVSLLLIIVFLYGHSMHVTANSINTYSTEIKNYINIIPNDTYSLIYFFDELLGHLLLYFGLFGVLSIWNWNYKSENKKLTSLGICGLIFGSSYGIAFIESSQAWLAPVVIIWFLGVSIFLAKKQNITLLELVKINPISQFSLTTALGIFLSASAYFFVTGGFVEPSKYIS